LPPRPTTSQSESTTEEPGRVEIEDGAEPEEPRGPVTQREFAIRLVQELGLEDDPDAGEAADLLNEARITPRLGQWELDEPMTAELALRLRQLTVAAAEQGRIDLSPEQSALAFDTAMALLGVPMPDTARSEEDLDEDLRTVDTPETVYAVPSEVFPVVSGVFIVDGDRRFHKKHPHGDGFGVPGDHHRRHDRTHRERIEVLDPFPPRPPSPGSFAPLNPAPGIVVPRPSSPPQRIHRQPPVVHRIDPPPTASSPASRSGTRSLAIPDAAPSGGRSHGRVLSLR